VCFIGQLDLTKKRGNMIAYEDIVTNATGTFPDTTAQNVSIPGAGDGTEFVAAVVDDIWGFHQALLDYAGMTPDDVTEAAGASQMVEALKQCFGWPGEVVMWHGVEDDPNAEFGCKLIPLEGQCITVADYPDIVEAVYVGDGNNATYPVYYRCDNSNGTTRNTAGAYLRLADTRGVFVRGYDPTGENDPDGASRLFPAGKTISDLMQECSMQEHDHRIKTDGGYYANSSVAYTMTPAPGGTIVFVAEVAASDELETQALLGVEDNADETRPINFQVKFCIRY
jgi:hypothetical protein